MKRMPVAVVVCWVLCMPGVFSARAEVPESAADQAIHDSLRALKSDMEQALNARDLERMLSHVTEDVVFTTMNNDVLVGKEALRTYYEKMLNGPEHVVASLTAKFEVDDLTRLYGTTGLAQGSSLDHYVLSDGTALDVHGRWSCALVNRDGQWRIASFHYSTNVFDNPVLDKLKRVSVGIGGAAAALMLVVGFILGRVTAGRPKGPA